MTEKKKEIKDITNQKVSKDEQKKTKGGKMPTGIAKPRTQAAEACTCPYSSEQGTNECG